MRKQLLAGASAVALSFGMAGGAAAQSTPDSAANATVTPQVGVETEDEEIIDNGNTAVDIHTRRQNIADGDFTDATGIATMQQNNGSSNVLDAATASLANIELADGEDVTADSEVDATTANNHTQHDGLNAKEFTEAEGIDDGLDRENAVSDSFSEFDGTSTTQQNNGDNNVIGSSTAVVGSVPNDDGQPDPATIVGTAGSLTANATANATTEDQGGFTQGDEPGAGEETDTLLDKQSVRHNDVSDGAYDGAGGIQTLQQNNGNGNALASATSVIGDSTGTGTPDINQTADANPALDMDGNTVQQEPVTEFASDNDMEQFDPIPDDRSNAINGSMNDSLSGVSTVQQNNGDANSLASATSVVGDIDGNPASVDQEANTSEIEVTGVTAIDGVGGQQAPQQDNIGSTRTNTIDPSYRGAMGVHEVQQNNGNANAIGQSTAVTAIVGGTGGDVNQEALSENNSVSNVTATDYGSTRTNTLDNAFDLAGGVFTVQQNNGDANAMAASTALTTVTGQVGDDIEQVADAELNTVDNVSTTDAGSDRTNTVVNSFDGSSGIATVQQNNGNANTVNAGTALTVAEGGVDSDISQTFDGTNNPSGFQSNVTNVEVEDQGSTRSNALGEDGSQTFRGYDGIATVQQNNGDANSLNAFTTVAAVDGNVGDDLDQDRTRSDQHRVFDFDDTNQGTSDPNAVVDEGADRDNTIEKAFNPRDDNAKGIATVQQNNGSANSVNAGTSVAIIGDTLEGDVTQTADADQNTVGDLSGQDEITQTDGTRNNTIADAFAEYTGVATVQQNNGDGNVMSTATNVAALTGNAGDSTGSSDPVDQTVTVGDSSAGTDNKVRNITATDDGGERTNDMVSGAFDSAAGVLSLQQNNGNGNVLAQGTDVVVAAGNVGQVSQTVDAEGSIQGVNVTDNSASRVNTINNSFNNATGIASLQQNNGDANTLDSGTSVAAAGVNFNGDFVPSAEEGNTGKSKLGVMGLGDDPLTSGGATGGTTTQDVTASGNLDGSNDITNEAGEKTNEILNAFSNAAGIVTAQQNNGNVNTMNAATGVTVATGGFEDVDQDATADGNITDENDAVTATDPGDVRENTIDPSFDGAAGVMSVQQNNGDQNVMNVANAITINTLGGGGRDIVNQTATATGSIMPTSLTAEDTGGEDAGGRLNTVSDSSFEESFGVMSVQQNNGDNNVVGNATAVVANTFSDNAQSSIIEQGQTAETSGTIDGEVNSSDVDDVTADSGIDSPDPDPAEGVSSGDSGAALNAGSRENRLNGGAFANAQGIASVQQNNGSNNITNVANAMRVDLGADGSNSDEAPGDPSGNADEDIVEQTAKATGDILMESSGSQMSEGGEPNPQGPGVAPAGTDDFDRENKITGGAFNGFKGQASIQQNNGDNNVMGEASTVAAAVGQTDNPTEPENSGLSGDDLDQVQDSTAETGGTVESANAVDVETNRLNRVKNAFKNAFGLLKIQQNNGNNNVMNAASAVVANLGVANFTSADEDVTNTATGTATVMNSEADAEDGTFGATDPPNTDRLNQLGNDTETGGMFNDSGGIATVQQNNGNNNVMGSATAVTAGDIPSGGSSDQRFGPAVSTASLSGTVTGNSSAMNNTGDPGDLVPMNNEVKNSFNGYSGVATVQQNNGNNNVVQSAVTVTANF